MNRRYDALIACFNKSLSSHSSGSVTVVVGPSGCGKTVAVCRAFKASVGSDCEVHSFDELAVFHRFLDSAFKYSPLSSNSESGRGDQFPVILVIKDPPFSLNHEPSRSLFVQLVRAACFKLSLVFIFTDSIYREHGISRLFGHCGSFDNSVIPCTTIEFNAVARTHLPRLVDAVDKSRADDIYAASGGDMRYAKIIASLVSANSAISGSPAKKRKRKGALPQVSIDMSRDLEFELFHALGKVMYAKRVRTDITGDSARPRLENDLSVLIDRVSSHTFGGHFNMHIYGNIPSFLDNIQHIDGLTQCEIDIRLLSQMSDTLVALSDADFVSRSLSATGIDYSLEIGVRGTCYASQWNSGKVSRAFFSFKPISLVSEFSFRINGPDSISLMRDRALNHPRWTFCDYACDYVQWRPVLNSDAFSSQNQSMQSNWWTENDDIT